MSRMRRVVQKKTQAVTRQASMSAGLLGELRAMIVQARAGVARAVDSALTTLYWHIGRRVRADILKHERAAYGQEIVSALGRQLSAEFGRGFDDRTGRRQGNDDEIPPPPELGDLAKVVMALWQRLLGS